MTNQNLNVPPVQPEDIAIKQVVDDDFWEEHGSDMAFDTYISLHSEKLPRIAEAKMTAEALLADITGTSWSQSVRQLTAFFDQFLALFGVPEEGMLAAS